MLASCGGNAEDRRRELELDELEAHIPIVNIAVKVEDIGLDRRRRGLS
jgi:hypothetical protein